MTSIRAVGEFNLIDRLVKHVARSDRRVRVGIGDDAAAVQVTPEQLLLLTTDAFVEGIHFDPRLSSWYDIGWKCIAANLSDIAAMAGIPQHALVALAIPDTVSLQDMDDLYQGMADLSQLFRVTIVGGDTTASPERMFITITVTGEVTQQGLVCRAGAHPGDLIGVTGDLGGSEAGRRLLQRKDQKAGPLPEITPGKHLARLVQKHNRPQPRVAESSALGQAVTLHAMVDISDGLSSEIHHLCQQSGVGARLIADRLPIHADVAEAAALLNLSPLELALHSGEEFELVFTLPPDQAEKARQAIQQTTATPLTWIGEITPATSGVRLVLSDGETQPLAAGGYDHFKSQRQNSHYSGTD